MGPVLSSISDEKVDTFLPQIADAEKTALAVELRFNVAVLRGSVKAEKTVLEDRVRRLHAVEREIRRVKSVGYPESGEPWIEGTMTFTAASFPKEANVMLFFSDGERHMLALARSAHHVVGNVRPATAVWAASIAAQLVPTLRSLTEQWAGTVEVLTSSSRTICRPAQLKVAGHTSCS